MSLNIQILVYFLLKNCNPSPWKISLPLSQQSPLPLALVRSIYKKYDRDQIKNYKPCSLLNGFSKVYERFLHNSLSKFRDKIFSKFISTSQKSNSSSVTVHVLMSLIEDWKISLYNKELVKLYSWTCLKHLTASLMTYLLKNVMQMY